MPHATVFRHAQEDVANASEFFSNVKESVVEGKDATLDADDDRGIKDHPGVMAWEENVLVSTWYCSYCYETGH